MISRPPGVGKFQFVVLASLRAAQLIRGCPARVDGGHKCTVTALLEVSQGKVTQMAAVDAAKGEGIPADAVLAAVAV